MITLKHAHGLKLSQQLTATKTMMRLYVWLHFVNEWADRLARPKINTVESALDLPHAIRAQGANTVLAQYERGMTVEDAAQYRVALRERRIECTIKSWGPGDFDYALTRGFSRAGTRATAQAIGQYANLNDLAEFISLVEDGIYDPHQEYAVFVRLHMIRQFKQRSKKTLVALRKAANVLKLSD